MLLASLAVTLFTAQAAPPADDAPGKVWESLDVMRRMLVHQVGSRHAAISAAPRPTEDGDVVTKDGKVVSTGRVKEGTNPLGYLGGENLPEKGGADSVATSYLRARNVSWTEGSIASDSEYVPGLAAIFSLTVPVKVRIVTSEPKTAEARKPIETTNADDEAWDRLARGEDDPVDRHVKTLLGQGGKGTDEPRRELKFDDAAMKALRETVADTVARFGSRLGLSHGERLAVVVKLAAGTLVNDGDSSASDKKGEPRGDDREVHYDSYVARSDLFGGTTYLDSRFALAARRFVLQVSADDLRAFKNGSLERDELMRKMRFEEFTVPGSASFSNYPFSWNNRSAK